MIRNERDFAEWFKENFEQFGFSEIIRKDIGICPDFIMLRNDKEINVELETYSSNFVAHNHSIECVDEIICLVKDIELEKPILVANNIKYSLPCKVTLSIDEDIYSKFKKYCTDNAIMLSKKIELFMKKELEANK